MADPAMTPPAAGWDAEAAARELEREWMLASSLAEQRAIIARHLTLARAAAPSAEAMRRCIEQFADHKNWYDAVGCLQWMGKRHAIEYAESVLSALPPAQSPAVALSSIPAAEIEALRKVVTVELERDEWNHRVATHLRSFLARLQSPTPAGEADHG